MTRRGVGGAQRLGRALMLPIAVLPIAGLLLRLGQPDLLDLATLAEAGQAIFDHLPLLFAIGVAVGLARENHGVAGLAGAVGHLVLDGVLSNAAEVNLLGDVASRPLDMGVLGGILAGLIAGAIYQRYHAIELPAFLGFFAGRRFVAIASGLACLALGAVMVWLWPPIQRAIDTAGHWLLGAGALGLFAYGVLNRLLLVTGLHHILNSLVWFVFGSYAVDGRIVHGDLHRFFAGDPGAGAFMAGFFPIMIFALPAACLAMAHAARAERRRAASGLYLSMGLTSATTGITEPIEFSFMFHAPLLYLLHAVLTGASMALLYLLGVRLGFTFSAGAIDAALSWGLGDRAWLLLPVGLAYAAVYYAIFRVAVVRLDLPVPGREAGEVSEPAAVAGERGAAFVAALGGADNLVEVDACATRLRLLVRRNDALDERALAALGARAVVRPAPGSAQVVLGPEADAVAGAIRAALAGGGGPALARGTGAVAGLGARPSARFAPVRGGVDRAAWIAALGGAGNVRAVEVVAATRLRIEVADEARVDEAALSACGAGGMMRLGGGLIHVAVGDAAAAVARALR